MKQMKSIFTLSILGFLALVNGQTDSDVISSGGASFPEEAYSAAMTDFGATYSSEYRLKLYDTTDSTTGQRNVVNGQYNWGGSDFGVNPALTTPNAPIVALPAIAGGLVITCNLPGIKDQVKLSRTVLPRIFDGTITLWNDPLLIRDNPFLASLNSTQAKIKVIQRSATSGSSKALISILKLMDASTGFNPSPYSSPTFQLNVANSATAKTTIAAGIMVAGFPFTITYLNQIEAQDAVNTVASTTQMALVQHIDGSFIAWSPASVRAAISNIDANKIQSLNMSTGSVEAFDIPTAGAYPITMVSNFIINPQHISSEPHVTIGTLKFLWMFLQNPKVTFYRSSVILSKTIVIVRPAL